MRHITLSQLILASFVVALIPLAALLWQTQQSFSAIRTSLSDDIGFIAQLVERSQQLENAMVSVERAVRQFEVLSNSASQQLLNDTLRSYYRLTQELCSTLSDSAGCQHLTHSALQTKDSKALVQLQQRFSMLRTDVDIAIKARLTAQNERLAEEQRQQALLSLLLASLSLVLILAGRQLIMIPVSKMQELISLIAQPGPTLLPPVSRYAPKELRLVEQDLHWLSDRLEQLEHIRKALLRHAAHELKTPLASIKEGCSLLSDGTVGALNTQQQEVMHWLDNSVARLNGLIIKLLDYNQLLQQAKPTYAPIDLTALIAQCCQDYQTILSQHALEVALAVTHITTDEQLLRRIFDNLISNAIAHGAPDTAIFIKSWREGQWVIIEIANIGTPIAAEEVNHLFEPFIRGKGPRNDDVVGAGLGLSIVSDCTRLLQGKVRLVNVDYADVCFRVWLPQQEG